jgi:mono/diheme cytochrome c family protein
MSRAVISALLLAGCALPIAVSAAQPEPAAASRSTPNDSQQIERGRYLAKIAGCNDCHTAGYAMRGGKVPESEWLMGDNLGWRGPWGTTYPTNLRLYMRDLSETAWVKVAKNIQARPPMPWFALNDMTEQDLKAIYRFTRSLGPVGEPAPAYVPPTREPQGPYIQFPAPPK